MITEIVMLITAINGALESKIIMVIPHNHV
jgi:hypothetical protein